MRPRSSISTCAARRTWSLDLGVGSLFLGADPGNVRDGGAHAPDLRRDGARPGAAFGVGRYGETRGIYLSPLFAPGGRPTDERRTVHLGIDLFVEPGAAVRAPLAGVVHVLANNRAPQDYGPLVILRHEAGDGTPFFTLYGHLTEDTLAGLALGQTVEKGQAIARVGAPPTNGDWPPHLHFQLILDLLELDADFPGVALPEPAPAVRGALARPEPAAAHPARALPRRASRRPRRRSRRGGGSWARTCGSPTRGRSRSCAASGSTSTTTPGARTSTSTTTCRSWATATRAWCARRRQQLALLNTNTRYLHDAAGALRASGSRACCPSRCASATS